MTSAVSRRAVHYRFRALVLVVLVIEWAVVPVVARQAPQADNTLGNVAAQDQTVPAGTFARAVTREAMRLAAVQSGGGPAESNWWRVRRIAPGTELTLTVKGSAPGAQRYFVAGDDSDLTVMNVADPSLPAVARDVLRRVALRHPGDFQAAQQGRQIALEKSIRLGPDGVFVSDRKVADLGQIVETIARDDVREIATQEKGRGIWGHLGSGGGFLVGSMGGGMAGGFVAGFGCRAAVGQDRCDSGAFLLGALVGDIVGAIAGGAYGYHAAHRETEVVIYRAPWLEHASGGVGSE